MASELMEGTASSGMPNWISARSGSALWSHFESEFCAIGPMVYLVLGWDVRLVSA